jgi:hypothetical protein
MDLLRPLAGITVVLVFGTAVATGLQLSHTPDPRRSTATPVLTPTSPATTVPLAPTTVGPQPSSPVPLPPQSLPPQSLPSRSLPPSSVARGPQAQTAAQLAAAGAAQRHAAAYGRLRRQAILLCRRWGFTQARCDTAPR